MNRTYTLFPDLTAEIREIPKDGILSRSLLGSPEVKATLFGFDAGQELTEHTAAYPAILHFIQGEADLTLGGDPVAVKAGAWVHMPAHLPHSLRGENPGGDAAPADGQLILPQPDPKQGQSPEQVIALLEYMFYNMA